MVALKPKASPEARQKAISAVIDQLNADRKPILCGPWRSEVGFEALYWTPFLRFLATKVKEFDKRAAVITRGGLAPVYANIASQGYDLYALRSVTDVRREGLQDFLVRNKQQTTKQLTVTPWDEAVLRDGADALKLGPIPHVIHPSLMYWALSPFWEETCGLKYLASMTDYAKLPKLHMPDMPPLPKHYVAVKVYGRSTFPYPHPQVAAWVQRTVATIAAQAPVVCLNSSNDYDDHVDIPLAGENVFQLPSDLRPEENLAVQAAVISQATCVVGTYGGMAQLALRLGVPSVSVWHDWGGTAHAHLSLSSWLSKAQQVPFLAGSMADCGLWEQLVSLPAKMVTAA